MKRLLSRWFDDPVPLPPEDERLALAALMVRIARADGDVDLSERDRIGRVLARRYSLSPFVAQRLLVEAEAAEADAPDTVRFTRAIKSTVPHEARLAVIEALWAVALADGRRDPEEDTMLRLIAPMLGIDDQDSALARQRASAAAVGR